LGWVSNIGAVVRIVAFEVVEYCILVPKLPSALASL